MGSCDSIWCSTMPTSSPSIPARPRAGSLGIIGDRIVAVGDGASCRGTRPIESSISTGEPSFPDSTTPTITCRPSAATLNEVPLQATAVHSIEEIVAAIADRVATTPAGVWVVGAGYDDNKLAERRHPTRHELDRVSPDNPVLLNHTSGHFCVVNTAAMRLARVGEVAVPEGGVVASATTADRTACSRSRRKDSCGPSLHPMAVGRHRPGPRRRVGDLPVRGDHLCQEAGVGGILGTAEPLEARRLPASARPSGRLRVRVTLMPIGREPAHRRPPPRRRRTVRPRPRAAHRVRRRMAPVRRRRRSSPTDRSSVARRRCSTTSRASPATRATSRCPRRPCTRLIIDAHRSGWQVATHAIGDRAVSSVLDAYAEAQRRTPGRTVVTGSNTAG